MADGPPSPASAGRRSSQRVVKRVLLSDYVVDPSVAGPLSPSPLRVRVDEAGSSTVPDTSASPASATRARHPPSASPSASVPTSPLHSPLPPAGTSTWSYLDDHLLIQGVHQALDLSVVAREVNFACATPGLRSPAALARRWQELLYNPRVSGPAIAQMQANWDRLAEVSANNVPFSAAELHLLHEFVAPRQSRLASDPRALSTSELEQLLQEHRATFHPSRNVWWLRNMVVRLVHSATPIAGAGSASTWTHLTLHKTRGQPPMAESAAIQAALDRELDRNAWKERRTIMALEAESAADKFFEMDKRVLAVLRGERRRYEIKGKQTVIGRASPSYQVDVDLTDAGAVPSRLSRHHALLVLDAETAQFRIYCMGLRAIYVNGEPVPRGTWRTAHNGALIEIADVPLLLRVNTIMTNRVRRAVAPATPGAAQGTDANDDADEVDV